VIKKVLEKTAWAEPAAIFNMIEQVQEGGQWPLQSLVDKTEPRPLLPRPGAVNSSNANSGRGETNPGG